ncbi:LacI family DNA-binding transcriptional regulator [Hyphomicrobium sp.]|uniref:LacI family DNA-binding transcriptional regulator n=1 Tax=Hyphomicrobium sp. TaxID=82 RepID=UPI002FE064FD
MNGGMPKPTIKDVALEAGVSLGTASRVINRFSDVNVEMRLRVERAIRKLGYTPDAVAQSMRSRSTRTIGILIRDFSSPAFVSFATVVQSLLYREGYVPLLAGYADEPRRELEILSAFAQRRIDGLIVTTSSDSDARLADTRRKLAVPTILFDRDPDGEQDTIAVDHRSGIQQVMTYLLKLGHRRVALLTGAHHVRPARERIEAFIKAHHDAGLVLDPMLLRTGSFTAEFAEQQSVDLLALPNRPTAIIAGGVNMLPGVLLAIRAAGLSIPKDISVVSSTNPELCELFMPTVTELRVDYGAMGVEASQLMLGRVQGTIKGPPRILRFDTTLIERESCAPPHV